MRCLKYQIPVLLIGILLSCSSEPVSDNKILQIVKGKDDIVDKVLADPDHFKLQILYTQIDRDSLNRPIFRSYDYNVDESEYFYPASTVKMPTAFMALEKLNRLNIKGLNRYSTFITDSAFSGQIVTLADSSSKSGFPSIDNYIKRIFLVSDNDAFNRLYEFVGQQELNEGLRSKGYKNTRITHRLEIFLSKQENQATNPVKFYNGDTLIYQQPLIRSEIDFTSQRPILLGKGYIRNGEMINEPMDFTQKNYISVPDLQKMLKSVLFYEYVDPRQTFMLTQDDYNFLYQYMSEYPGESQFPSYDSAFYPSYVKFLMFGNTTDPVPGNFRIFNKVGDAYGFMIDNAYIIDFENKIEFLLTVVMQVNENQIYNDGKYEYDQIGFPFFEKFGVLIYEHEKMRKKKYLPDLTKFKLNYN